MRWHRCGPRASVFLIWPWTCCSLSPLSGILPGVKCIDTVFAGTVSQLLALLALPPHSKKVMGSIPAWGAVGSWGQVLPRVHSAQVGYLPGLSVWSLHVLPAFTRGFPPLRTPTEKTCKITEHMSIPDQRYTVHFTWSPGATSCPLLLGGP